MSHVFIRGALCAFISLSALCCGSDQKTSNTPDDASSEAPADTSTPQPGDATMPATNGQPTENPPAGPSPTSLNQGTPSNAVATPQVASEPSTRTQLTESQIAMVAQLANSSEIDQAKLAQGKAKATSVKNFAAMMIKHHTETKTEQTKLFKQLDLTPTQSQSATALQQAGEATLVKLRAATSAAFDARYMDSQVDAHQKVLDSIDSELLPAATDRELIASLKKMKATVESHLAQAKVIQAELANRGPTAR